MESRTGEDLGEDGEHLESGFENKPMSCLLDNTRLISQPRR